MIVWICPNCSVFHIFNLFQRMETFHSTRMVAIYEKWINFKMVFTTNKFYLKTFFQKYSSSFKHISLLFVHIILFWGMSNVVNLGCSLGLEGRQSDCYLKTIYILETVSNGINMRSTTALRLKGKPRKSRSKKDERWSWWSVHKLL